MECRYNKTPIQKHEGGSVTDNITTPLQLGKTLKAVFKNRYGIDINTRYIKTVRGLDGSYYEIDTFRNDSVFPNDVRAELLELSYGKPLLELNITHPHDIHYGSVSSKRIALYGKDWKKWLVNMVGYFEEGGKVGCGCPHFEKGGTIPEGAMTYEDFKKQLPAVKSPFVGEEQIIYKPTFDTMSNRMKYHKSGRKGSQKISDEQAYKTYLYDNFGIVYDNLSNAAKAKLKNRKVSEFKRGGKADVNTRHFRYLDLIPSENGLTIKLNDGGKEKVADDDLDYNNWDEYFEDVQGNSEYIYVHDIGEKDLVCQMHLQSPMTIIMMTTGSLQTKNIKTIPNCTCI